MTASPRRSESSSSSPVAPPCAPSISKTTKTACTASSASTTARTASPPAPAPDSIRAPIQAYFEGDLAALARVLVETGGTAFQRKVWAALRRIPAGTTATYGQLAAAIGNANASRAVGMANGSNPVAIVVPCHRVIGAGGGLTGYAGGTDRKRWLLTHEGVKFQAARVA